MQLDTAGENLKILPRNFIIPKELIVIESKLYIFPVP